MDTSSHYRNRSSQRGQIVILLSISMIVLLLLAGLAIDVAFAYVTKARLSKAVDAACLTGMKNLFQGQSTARILAQNSFNANYGTLGDINLPVVDITFSNNPSNQLQINVTATATIKTAFMGIFPAAQTLTVGGFAQALRGKLVMSLVLDRSGSMQSNGGSTALKSAVPTFLNYFSNTDDEAAMISFASNDTVDVAMENNFIVPITNKVSQLNFVGGTFGPGGITDAKAQDESVVPLPGENVIKIMVYFTDGYINTVQDTFNCVVGGVTTPTLYNYGGVDSGNGHFFVPSSGTDLGTVNGSGYPPAMPPAASDCSPVTRFTSQIDGRQRSFTGSYIAPEARYRALQTATAMLNEGMIIYSIGLGSNIDEAFLKQIANDPSSASYDSSLPQGLAVFAPDCPSSTCNAELQQVFQTIAAKILLRLTQ